MMNLITIIRRRRAAEAALKESRARFHTLVETAPALIFATDRAGRNSFVNERYQTYTGLSFQELCGEGWLSVIHPADRPAAHSESASAQVHIRPLERRLRIRRHDGAWRWFLSRTEPVVGASEASPFAWLGISIDIDEQVHAEERERLLAQEVDHRAKNVLTLVQSLVQLTRGDDADELKAAIIDRIQALARSHSLVAASSGQGVELVQLLQDELAAFTGQASIDGSGLRLEAAAAQSLGLVIHELATNSAKYGALSVSSGEVRISWTISEETGQRLLALRWKEVGGPSVEKPARSGFGSTVIHKSVVQHLKGTVALHWKREGLICDLVIPTASACLGDALS